VLNNIARIRQLTFLTLPFQDNTLLTTISNTLIQNRCLRFALFGSLKIIRYDIVWEALMDLEDCNILRSSIDSMSEDALMNVLPIVDMKLNLVRHIIEHLENIAFLDLSVTESFAAHCMTESCFLLDGLTALRRRSIDVMEMQVCLVWC
jgi:hypothetical protein